MTGFLILITVAAATPQTSSELHALYGPPDGERFVVRPDITLSVAYGEDGRACAMRIEPRSNRLHSSAGDPTPSMEQLTEVLNEIVPPQERGKELGPGPAVWMSCAGAHPPTEYENVTISTNYGMCDRASTSHGFNVYFKRPGCKKLQPRRIPNPQ